MSNKLTEKEIQELSKSVGKPVPEEIVAILEKEDGLTSEEVSALRDFYGEQIIEWERRGHAVCKLHAEAAKKYREQHPPLLDPEWF
jgi:hypothetical protein